MHLVWFLPISTSSNKKENLHLNIKLVCNCKSWHALLSVNSADDEMKWIATRWHRALSYLPLAHTNKTTVINVLCNAKSRRSFSVNCKKLKTWNLKKWRHPDVFWVHINDRHFGEVDCAIQKVVPKLGQRRVCPCATTWQCLRSACTLGTHLQNIILFHM